jgi:hypothetical protein
MVAGWSMPTDKGFALFAHFERAIVERRDADDGVQLVCRVPDEIEKLPSRCRHLRNRPAVAEVAPDLPEPPSRGSVDATVGFLEIGVDRPLQRGVPFITGQRPRARQSSRELGTVGHQQPDAAAAQPILAFHPGDEFLHRRMAALLVDDRSQLAAHRLLALDNSFGRASVHQLLGIFQGEAIALLDNPPTHSGQVGKDADAGLVSECPLAQVRRRTAPGDLSIEGTVHRIPVAPALGAGESHGELVKALGGFAVEGREQLDNHGRRGLALWAGASARAREA